MLFRIGRYEQNDDTHGRRNDSRQNMRPPPAINQEPNSQVKSQVNSDASLPGESQTEYMMRTAKIRREKRLAEVISLNDIFLLVWTH